MSPLGFAACQSKKCTNRARTDCLLVKFNNGLNGLNGFLLLGIFNNGLNGLNGFLLLEIFNNGLNGFF